MHVYRGDYYFPTRAGAETWAASHGWPTDFIRSYTRGYAVQACNSGQYAGPDNEGWPGPRWDRPHGVGLSFATQ